MSAAPKNWQEINALFERALKLSPQDRAAFLENLTCDSAVRAEVLRLLGQHKAPTEFATSPVTRDPQSVSDYQRRSLAPGDLLASRFKVIQFIADGGMGEVYEGEDIELREFVALKTIRQSLLEKPSAVSRFKQEVRLARQITHSSVCRVYDLFRHTFPDGGQIIFISMELLRGKTLSRQLHDDGRFGVEQTLALATQIANALSAAHDAGIVHRDFKPGNVILVPDERCEGGFRVVVTDFGLAVKSVAAIAAADATVSVLGSDGAGTPAYMAPEQIEGRPATPASDIYSFGLVLYEMVTGQRPFEGATPTEAALNRLRKPPIPPSRFVPGLSLVWQTTILKCLEIDPANRFAKVQDVIAELSGAGKSPAAPEAVPAVQDRVLEAAAPKEAIVGRSTEVLALVRGVVSDGLKGYLGQEQDAASPITPQDVRGRPFQLEFTRDEFGQLRAAEIALRLESPDFEPTEQTKKVRVPVQGDSTIQTFLVTPRLAGQLVMNLEVLRGEEVVVSRSIRVQAALPGGVVSQAKEIISIPLTIIVQPGEVTVATKTRIDEALQTATAELKATLAADRDKTSWALETREKLAELLKTEGGTIERTLAADATGTAGPTGKEENLLEKIMREGRLAAGDERSPAPLSEHPRKLSRVEYTRLSVPRPQAPARVEAVASDTVVRSESVRKSSLKVLRVAGISSLFLAVLAGTLFFQHRSIQPIANNEVSVPPPRQGSPAPLPSDAARANAPSAITTEKSLRVGQNDLVLGTKSASPLPAKSDQELVISLVEKYKSAYEAGNIQQLKSLWPLMPQEEQTRLEQLFKQPPRHRISLSVEQATLRISGGDAGVNLQQTYARQGTSAVNRRVLSELQLELKKSADGNWYLTSCSVK